jgi:molybdopterin/thiamine biosynthesis adenylyltransferase
LSTEIPAPGLEPAGATVIDPNDPDDLELLQRLRTRPEILVIDRLVEQRRNLEELLPRPDESLLAEPYRWVHYPWRRTLVCVLGPRAFRRVRLDRNRNLITIEEQERLGALRIGIVGLSVGHAIAHTLAIEGVCGQLRLADFDELELTNLNRVPASLFDIGINKAVVAAQRIAEIDPYVDVQVATSGVTPESVDRFVDGLDIVVEECDSLDIKLLVREAARTHGVPVLMASSDRGLIDVERFDEDPGRPVLHGLLGDADRSRLATLSSQEKVPYVLKVVEAAKLSARGAAALVEVGRTLATWPQLAGDVLLGAAAVTRAVQRVGLGHPLPSGRIRLDVDESLTRLVDPATAESGSPAAASGDDHSESVFTDVVDVVAAAAIRAPSGGNTQPWRLTTTGDSIELAIAAEYTSMMDVEFRASAIALGAAIFNTRVAAAAHGMHASVDITEHAGHTPLQAVCTLTVGCDTDLADWYRPMLDRHTNRHVASPAIPIDEGRLDILRSVAEHHGARLVIVDDRDRIERIADIVAESDRIRYLTPRLHAEMVSELRWPDDEHQETGIDVNGLEVGQTGLQAMEILRRPEVMAQLAAWNAGQALGDDGRVRLRGSSALAVLVMSDAESLVDYARGGSALEAVWVAAQRHHVAVHPVSPVFLYARTDSALRELAPGFAPTLARLQRAFRELIGLEPNESEILVLRLNVEVPPPSVRSRRRRLASNTG